LEDLGATYDEHLRLIGKRVVDFPLVLIEFFSLGVTAEALRANICSKSASPPPFGVGDEAEHCIPDSIATNLAHEPSE